MDNLDLPGRRLSVRQGKGLRDRTVYLAATACAAVQAYLTVRGMGPADHAFLYRNAPLCKDLVRERLYAAGKRAGVKVHPHRLRHTCATQLLNAGCRVTSIQKFLGHKRLNSTMIYARVHDQTVAEDYYAAMGRVEQRLESVLPELERTGNQLGSNERAQLLELAAQLAGPDLADEERLALAKRLQLVLNGRQPRELWTPQNENGRRPRPPPQPSPASSWVSLT